MSGSRPARVPGRRHAAGDGDPSAPAGGRSTHARGAHTDTGNALIEFVFLAVLLMIPLVYVLLTVFHVQRAAYAANAATREAGRAFATADSDADGYTRATVAASVALADHGLRLPAGQPVIDCSTQPCLTPGARIHVRLDTEVGLPLLPRVLDGRTPASIGIHARHVAYVDEYRRAAS